MSYTVGVKVVEYLKERGLLRQLSPSMREDLSREIDAMLGYPDSKIPFNVLTGFKELWLRPSIELNRLCWLPPIPILNVHQSREAAESTGPT